jgi:hypothetical protein
VEAVPEKTCSDLPKEWIETPKSPSFAVFQPSPRRQSDSKGAVRVTCPPPAHRKTDPDPPTIHLLPSGSPALPFLRQPAPLRYEQNPCVPAPAPVQTSSRSRGLQRPTLGESLQFRPGYRRRGAPCPRDGVLPPPGCQRRGPGPHAGCGTPPIRRNCPRSVSDSPPAANPTQPWVARCATTSSTAAASGRSAATATRAPQAAGPRPQPTAVAATAAAATVAGARVAAVHVPLASCPRRLSNPPARAQRLALATCLTPQRFLTHTATAARPRPTATALRRPCTVHRRRCRTAAATGAMGAVGVGVVPPSAMTTRTESA